MALLCQLNLKDLPADCHDFVVAAIDYNVNTWTACAASATSWRKSNHATGGDIAQGFPRRWLQKENKLNDTIDITK